MFLEIPLNPLIENANELYSRKENDRILFNTFFGAIPISKIKKYTEITKLIFCFDITGTSNISLDTEKRTIVEKKIVNIGQLEINLSDIDDDAKLLYPVITLARSEDRIRKISVYAEGTINRDIRCALIICTYKREKYVKENVNYISKKLEKNTSIKCEIMVVDNGRTLNKKDFLNDVILIPNSNTGGSGGFTRGMIEANKKGNFSHILLMDDDVKIDFSVIQRTLSFLKYLKPEYEKISISGSMLYLDKPTFQFEAGGHFYENGLQKGYGHFLDLADFEQLYRNQNDYDINYGGWWYMLMPIQYVQSGQLPMPFFIKYDDVEYALRCKQEIITLNGVGIWHEKFEEKYNSASEYYNVRNYLHLCKMHCQGFSEKKAFRFVVKRCKAKLKRQQYNMANAVIKGYEDYRKGIDWLNKLDPEVNHKEICKLNYKFLSYDEINHQYGIRPQNGTFYAPPGKKRILYSLIPKKYVFADVFYDKPIQYFLKKQAVHCNSEKNIGYVTEQCLLKYCKIIKKCKLVFLKNG